MNAEAQKDLLEDRVATAVAVAYGQAGYATEEGAVDTQALTEVLTALVGNAVAMQKNERAKVGITRREIMAHAFPKIAGPEAWADQSDPELAQGVYEKLDAACWRLMAMGPDGPIQTRLNSDQGLVLCRTKVNPHKTDAVYVTRDLGCLLEDAIKPQRKTQKQRADREAAFTAMLIERVPEHGKRFHRELVGGLTTALNTAKAITSATLQTTLFEAETVDEAAAEEAEEAAAEGDA